MKHIAHSNTTPNSDDWVALTARVETIQDIVAALMVSPCCADEDILYSIQVLRDELYNIIEVSSSNE